MALYFLLLPLLMMLAPPATAADTMVTRTKTYGGTFERFENNRFVFRTEDGATVELERGQVTELTCDPPVDIALLRARSREPEAAKLLQYKGLRFSVELDGKEQTVFNNQVDRIVAQRPMPAMGGAGRAGAAPAVQFLNTAELEQNPDLPPNQQAALQRYLAAKDAYLAFRQESSEMVERLNRATGNERHQLLEDLRRRNIAEQPILAELDLATKAMYEAFPE